MDATGYLKHNATVQVTSGAVDCLFARELIRQFVVQNPAEVTDKANGERTVMSARCYWKPGDGVDRATPECVSLDGGSTVITVKLVWPWERPVGKPFGMSRSRQPALESLQRLSLVWRVPSGKL